ncbi:hypothetical protein [Nonomuraea sp. NPDC003214]
MDDVGRRPDLTGRQVRDLAGLALMAVGAVLTCVAAFMLHPAAGLGMVGVWLLGGGWLLATGLPDSPEGGR